MDAVKEKNNRKNRPKPQEEAKERERSKDLLEKRFLRAFMLCFFAPVLVSSYLPLRPLFCVLEMKKKKTENTPRVNRFSFAPFICLICSSFPACFDSLLRLPLSFLFFRAFLRSFFFFCCFSCLLPSSSVSRRVFCCCFVLILIFSISLLHLLGSFALSVGSSLLLCFDSFSARFIPPCSPMVVFVGISFRVLVLVVLFLFFLAHTHTQTHHAHPH